jgi:hypothetical protein
MSLHDLFNQAGRGRARRRLRLRRARRMAGVPVPPGRGRCGPLATARGRRRLAAIDRALAAQTPRLASMFAMFNELAEEPVSAERLPSRAWPRPGMTRVAFFAALAAIVALTVALSTQVRGVMRPCVTSASATSGAPPAASSSAAPAASSPESPFASSAASSPSSASPFASSAAASSAGQASGASALAAFVAVRGLSCQAYAAPNK